MHAGTSRMKIFTYVYSCLHSRLTYNTRIIQINSSDSALHEWAQQQVALYLNPATPISRLTFVLYSSVI
jgi:hypothetical protein